jgi:hypothetical protein
MGGGGYRNTTGSLAFRRDRLKRPLRRVSVGVAGLLGAAQVVCRNDARASRWRIVPAAGATAKGVYSRIPVSVQRWKRSTCSSGHSPSQGIEPSRSARGSPWRSP